MQITGKSLRNHLIAYVGLTLLMTLGLVVLVAWFPVSRRLHESLELSIRHDVELRARLVDETVHRMAELGWQVSSRTAARITTTEYERGLLPLEEARQVLTPRLRDAVEFSHDVRALVRRDVHGTVLVHVGQAVSDSLLALPIQTRLSVPPPGVSIHQGRQGLSGVFVLEGSLCAVLHTPVLSLDKRTVAEDLLVMDLGALRNALARPLLRRHDVACHVMAQDEDGVARMVMRAGTGGLESHDANISEPPPLLGSETHVLMEDGLLVATSPLTRASWWVVARSASGPLLRESRIWLLGVLATVLGIGLLGLAGGLLLMRPLRDRVLAAQEDQLRRVQELERDRQRLEAQSAQLLERNDDLRHFAFAAAHDLKSPLVSMGGHAQILLDRLENLPPERRKSLEYILAGSKRMFQHVNDMLDYSRAAELEPAWSPLALERLVQEILSSLDGRIRECGATIEVGNLPTIVTDRRLLRMVLQNLVENALNYRDPDRPPVVTVTAVRITDEVVIHVKDNGLGIAPDHQPQIFETYYRLHDDSSIPGTGLGLAICQRAVARLQGRIEVESEPGLGSCFHVVLPQADASTADGDGLRG